MAHTLKIALTVTDEDTGVETVANEYVERNVSLPQVVAMEKALVGVLSDRLAVTAGKLTTDAPARPKRRRR